MGDSIVRSTVGLIRSGRLGNTPVFAASVDAPRAINMELREPQDWQTLIGDGSVRSLKLNVGEVSEAFATLSMNRPQTTQRLPTLKITLSNFMPLLFPCPALGLVCLVKTVMNGWKNSLNPVNRQFWLPVTALIPLRDQAMFAAGFLIASSFCRTDRAFAFAIKSYAPR